MLKNISKTFEVITLLLSNLTLSKKKRKVYKSIIVKFCCVLSFFYYYLESHWFNYYTKLHSFAQFSFFFKTQLFKKQSYHTIYNISQIKIEIRQTQFCIRQRLLAKVFKIKNQSYDKDYLLASKLNRFVQLILNNTNKYRFLNELFQQKCDIGCHCIIRGIKAFFIILNFFEHNLLFII